MDFSTHVCTLAPIFNNYRIHFVFLKKPFHVGGKTLEEAFAHTAEAMYNYMVEVDNVELKQDVTIEVSGHDMESLLYNYLDEFLFQFSTEFIVCKEIKVDEFDKTGFKIKATGKGERLDKKKHTTGTEIKAITYSAMQIKDEKDKAEVYVIVDI
eukprot:Phypoly_transcript_22366.p1 GENE.Phypoly_transcript_22366~~Phypoly_transcript_22366.p1  ORF type:complete len:154 (+),score=23.01 Phypoly_transcript_22366:108-569(+)